MKMISLRSAIDDLLLIIRNNNVSESEDLSRMLLATWILTYRSTLLRQRIKEELSIDSEYVDESFLKTIGPLLLSLPIGNNGKDLYIRKTTLSIDDIFDRDKNNIVAVYDEDLNPIQKMHELRRTFHYFRKYTHGELTWDLRKDNMIYIYGYSDLRLTHNIYVKYISCNDDATKEDDIYIPEWMIPSIKEMIFKNELSVMLKMPSDDSNNSTLDGIKPNEYKQPKSSEK